jgi:hypothetical protein
VTQITKNAFFGFLFRLPNSTNATVFPSFAAWTAAVIPAGVAP